MEKDTQKGKTKKRILIAVSVIAALIVVLAVAVIAVYLHFYNKSNYVRDESFTVYYGDYPGANPQNDDMSGSGSMSAGETTPEQTPQVQTSPEQTSSEVSEGETDAALSAAAESLEELSSEELSSREPISEEDTSEEDRSEEDTSEEGTEPEVTQEATLSAEEEEEARRAYEEGAASLEQAKEKYVYNLLLIGVDRRDRSWYGNSDTMILVSVNSKTKKLFMTSFMRDLYADIPQIGVRKLNAAYARGAGPLLVQTIESNYKIDINNYASVDFGSMAGIIDMLGGIDIEISDAEAKSINGGSGEVSRLSGADQSDCQLQGGGLQHLNGTQAVAYARIRYIGNADYERTSRQRRVLEKLIQKARGMDAQTLLDVANQILPLITHNIDQTQLVGLLASLPEYVQYEIVMDRVPYDGAFGHNGEILVPDFEYTINRLQATIYEGIYAEQMPAELPGEEKPAPFIGELPQWVRQAIETDMKNMTFREWLDWRRELLKIYGSKA